MPRWGPRPRPSKGNDLAIFSKSNVRTAIAPITSKRLKPMVREADIEKVESLPAVGKREQILNAATRVFLTHGYAGTSMERVAKASGAARRTLYNQFESKEHLFEALTERIWTNFPIFDITRDAMSLEDPRVGLTRLGHAIAGFWMPDEAVAFLRVVISDGERFPGLTKIFVDKGKAPAMDAIMEYLQALAARSLIACPNARIAGRQFLGLIDEPLLWVRVVGIDETYSKAERHTIVDDAVDIFLRFYGIPVASPLASHG